MRASGVFTNSSVRFLMHKKLCRQVTNLEAFEPLSQSCWSQSHEPSEGAEHQGCSQHWCLIPEWDLLPLGAGNTAHTEMLRVLTSGQAEEPGIAQHSGVQPWGTQPAGTSCLTLPSVLIGGFSPRPAGFSGSANDGSLMESNQERVFCCREALISGENCLFAIFKKMKSSTR